MEKGGGLAVLLALVALGAPLVLLLIGVVLGLGGEESAVLVRSELASEVVVDPVRAGFGVGLAIAFTVLSVVVIRRTDWSLSEA